MNGRMQEPCSANVEITRGHLLMALDMARDAVVLVSASGARQPGCAPQPIVQWQNQAARRCGVPAAAAVGAVDATLADRWLRDPLCWDTIVRVAGCDGTASAGPAGDDRRGSSDGICSLPVDPGRRGSLQVEVTVRRAGHDIILRWTPSESAVFDTNAGTGPGTSSTASKAGSASDCQTGPLRMMQFAACVVELRSDAEGRIRECILIDRNDAFDRFAACCDSVARSSRSVVMDLIRLHLEQIVETITTGVPRRFRMEPPGAPTRHQVVITRCDSPGPGRALLLFLDCPGSHGTDRAGLDTELLFRALAEAGGMVFVLGSEGQMLYASPSWQHYFGTAPQAFCECGLPVRVHAQDLDTVREAWDAARQSLSRCGVVCRLRRGDGVWRWHDCRVVPVTDRSGELLSWCGTLTDVHEQREAMQQLRRHQELLQTLIDTIPVLICIWDPDLREFRFNRAFRETLGWTEDDANSGGDFMACVYPDPAYRDEVAEYMQSHEGGWRDLKTREKSGEFVDISWANVRLSDDMSVGIGIDIRDRIRAAAKLHEREEMFRNLADNMSQLAWMKDARGHTFWYNKRWFDFTGTTLEEVRGWGWQKLHHPDHVDRVLQTLNQSLQSGEVWEETFPLRGRDGRYRWFLTRAVPIRDDQGRVLRWFGTNTDITDQLRREEQLQVVLAELNHRVKNTLAVIQSVAQQMARNATSLDAFRQSFGERLRSIAAAHSLLTRSDWEGAEVGDIVGGELKSRIGSSDQAVLSGPRVMLPPNAVLSLHMAIHELATNACKYGALSQSEHGNGRIEVHWEVVEGDDRPTGEMDGSPRTLRIEWREQAPRSVEPPKRTGFGSLLVERVIKYELNGVAELRFEPTGLVCLITFPMPKAAPSTPMGPASPEFARLPSSGCSRGD